MAWTSGTATDYRDLLRRLRQFVTQDMLPASERWTQLRWDEQPETQELILKGPGLAGVDEIYVGIRSYENAAQGWYWWDVQGLTGFVSGHPFYGQPGAISDNMAGLSLHQYSIPYWFIVNGRRIIILAKVGTRYEQGYLGFMLPYALPSEHFYPMFVGGSLTPYGGSRLASRIDDGHRAFWHPVYFDSDEQYSAALVWMAGGWQRVANDPSGYRAMTYPYCMIGLGDWGQTLAGDYMLVPVQILRFSTTGDNRHSFGALDGVFYVSGMNNVAENIITVAGKPYLVMQNVFRNAWNEMAAYLLE